MSGISSIKYEIQKTNIKLDALKISIDSIVDYIGQAVPRKSVEPKKEKSK